MNMREKVAAAIGNAVGCSGYQGGEFVGCLSRTHVGTCDCLLSADAALSAMEEPDEGMVDEAIRWHAGPDADLAVCFRRQWSAAARAARGGG